jgi:hypothetical protein
MEPTYGIYDFGKGCGARQQIRSMSWLDEEVNKALCYSSCLRPYRLL